MRSNWDDMIDELNKAQADQDRAKAAIQQKVQALAESKRLTKAVKPWPQIEKEMQDALHAMAGQRLVEQRADVGSLMIKAMSSFREGKINAIQVSRIEAHVLHLDTHFSALQKSLSEFEQIRAQIKAARAQGKDLADQAAAQTKARLASIVASIAKMKDNLDISEAEAKRLRAIAEGKES